MAQRSVFQRAIYKVASKHLELVNVNPYTRNFHRLFMDVQCCISMLFQVVISRLASRQVTNLCQRYE